MTEQRATSSSSAAYVVPPARELKRERKALLEVREERLRDLGGLALEMYKRDRFNAGLVVERCAELVAIEVRLQEIDSLEERDAIDKALAEFKDTTGRCPSSLTEILQRLANVKLPGGRDFRVDKSRNIVDPTDTPYLLDQEKCKALIDAGKSGIATQ